MPGGAISSPVGPGKSPGGGIVGSFKECISQYLDLSLKLTNNRYMAMDFFMCIAVQSDGKIPKVQNLSEKNTYVIYF